MLKDLKFKYGRPIEQHKLTDEKMLKRKQHCKNYAYKPLTHFVFNDEALLIVSEYKLQIWYCNNEDKIVSLKDLAFCQVKIDIWGGGVSIQGKTDLFIHQSQ
ncbi:hypothetical protein ABPG72_014321 [Tetrahymena utriculariae]